MDIIDSANETNELYIQVSLSNRKVAIKSYSGMCIWCHEEPVAPKAHIAVKIVVMTMSSINGKMDRRMKWNIKY
ncbi:TPA: hypothetical protein ACKRRO_001615 [Proteus mirabilis]|uniref:hypothetical protein n=1 Tax=Proteus mirabilis TaxID=584 RepID=UPI001F04BCC1|nr:hypothetical protein [Proteus mirabilis]